MTNKNSDRKLGLQEIRTDNQVVGHSRRNHKVGYAFGRLGVADIKREVVTDFLENIRPEK
jgi:hypothetical protein